MKDYFRSAKNNGSLSNRKLITVKPVVVNLFCIGTHFEICSKTCTPLPSVVGGGDAGALQKRYGLSKIWAKSWKIWAKSLKFWAQCMKIWEHPGKNGAQLCLTSKTGPQSLQKNI